MAGVTRKVPLRRRGDRGVAAIEFAIIVPVLLALFAGTLYVFQFMNVNRKVKAAADLAADLVARNDASIQTAVIDDYFDGVKLLLRPIPADKIQIDIYDLYKKQISPNPSIPVYAVATRWSRSSAAVTDCRFSPDLTSANSRALPLVTSADQNNDVVLAVVCVVVPMPVTGFVGPTSRVIRQQMLMGLRESKTLCLTNPCPAPPAT